MKTGLKTVDSLIEHYGIRVQEGKDASQALMALRGGDMRINAMRLPYCIVQKIMGLPAHRMLKLHQWYLPHKKAKLAAFLIDEKGSIIEQVYYQRDAKHVHACRKVQQFVEAAQRQASMKGVAA